MMIAGMWDTPMRDQQLLDEQGRLAALRRYGVVEAGDDAPFRRIVELVQTILSVPVAAITLIDADRQWLKSARGTALKSLPRDETICNETIGGRGPLAITDATADRR